MDLSYGYGALGSLPILRDRRIRRASSVDRSGGKADHLLIEPDETSTFVELTGAGVIRHLWFEGGAEEPYYHRQVILRISWDGEDSPSVEVPLGDFFGVGHGAVGNFHSLPLAMSAVEEAPPYPIRNCWFPMPFAQGARFELVNEGQAPYYHSFSIDYEEHLFLSPDLGRFHAQWRCANPTSALVPPGDGLTRGREPHPDRILEAQGHGHYVGCVLSGEGLSPGGRGEGKERIVVDAEIAEARFFRRTAPLQKIRPEGDRAFSWGFPGGDTAGGLYQGISLPGTNPSFEGRSRSRKDYRWSVYQFHLEDPVPFRQRILVTFDPGSGQIHAEEWSSVAYWYQEEPHTAFPRMPSLPARLPRPVSYLP